MAKRAPSPIDPLGSSAGGGGEERGYDRPTDGLTDRRAGWLAAARGGTGPQLGPPAPVGESRAGASLQPPGKGAGRRPSGPAGGVPVRRLGPCQEGGRTKVRRARA